MTFNSLILIWFDKNQRNLPWRTNSEPYKVWLSEIILQQTRVAQGMDYFIKFIQTYPTIQDLAAASEQDVLKLWQGLGYYSRARNLHNTAKFIVENLHGNFPDNYKDLLKLKGVGPYTAAAIASIAFNQAVSAVDGNVFRVFSRYFDIDLDISQPKTRNYFFELGNEIIGKERPGDFNQAVMELGATICLPTPKCEICPVNNSCAALAKNTIDRRPVKTKKTKISHRYFHFMEISDGENFLMTKREGKDVWRNLFTFPLIESGENDSLKKTIISDKFQFEKTHQEIHVLTHQRLHITFWKTRTSFSKLQDFSAQLNTGIYSLEELDQLPLPRPMEKYLNEKI